VNGGDLPVLAVTRLSLLSSIRKLLEFGICFTKVLNRITFTIYRYNFQDVINKTSKFLELHKCTDMSNSEKGTNP